MQAGSGWFSFFGPNSVHETILYFLSDSFLANPYGKTSGASYGITGQVQHVTKNTLIYGAQVGYEQLTSHVAITATRGDFGISSAASGRGTLQNQYLNVNPFIGKRFGNRRFCLDATVGLDAGIGLFSRESAQLAQQNPIFFEVADQRRPMPDVDFRPRLNLTGYYRAFGLSVGYAHGVSNYAARRFSADAKIYAQIWRAGIVYRLGKHS